MASLAAAHSLHIEDIECHLNDYYVALGRHDFYESAKRNGTDCKIGKLRAWSDDNGFDTDSVLEDLELDPSECTVTSFDAGRWTILLTTTSIG